MGASLARLYIFDYNTKTGEILPTYDSIDTENTHPLEKAKRAHPYDSVIERSNWSKDDEIIRIITVPRYYAPIGYVHNQEHKVTVNCSKNLMAEFKVDSVVVERIVFKSTESSFNNSTTTATDTYTPDIHIVDEGMRSNDEILDRMTKPQ